MKTLKEAIVLFVVTAIFLFVSAGVVSFLVARPWETTGDRYYVITNGECFAYGTITWFSGDCFDTKEEATKKMNSFLEFIASEKRLEESNWVEVIDQPTPNTGE